jgi:hypothetical protein
MMNIVLAILVDSFTEAQAALKHEQVQYLFPCPPTSQAHPSPLLPPLVHRLIPLAINSRDHFCAIAHTYSQSIMIDFLVFFPLA